MKRTAGRPKTKNPRKLMAFRFRPEYAALLRKISKKKKIPQVRVLESSLDIAAKQLPF